MLGRTESVAAPRQKVSLLSGERWTEGFLLSAAILLFATSLMKLLSIGSGPRLLLAPDPLLRIRLSWLMLGESALEVAVAGLLVSKADRGLRLLAAFWLGALFCGYHLALAIFDPHAYCPCLGTLYGRLGIKPITADRVAKLLSLYFLTGPLFMWFWKPIGRLTRWVRAGSV